MTMRQDTISRWGILLRWCLFTMAGWLFYHGGSLLINSSLPNLPTAVALAWWVVATAAVASLQWFALRSLLTPAWHWILASGLGMGLGATIAFPLKLEDWYVPPSGFQLDEVAFGAVLGLVAGVAQWWILRRHLPRAGWWVIGSSLGWALGMAVGEILPLNWNRPTAGFIYELVIAAVATAVLGVTLLALLQGDERRAKLEARGAT